MQPGVVALAASDLTAEESFLQELARVIGQRQYEHWFQNKTSCTLNEDELTIGAASPFLIQWLQKQFKPVATKVAQDIFGPAARVRFEIDPQLSTVAMSSAKPEDINLIQTLPKPMTVPSATIRNRQATSSQGLIQRTDVTPSAAQAGIALGNTTLGKPRTGRRFADLSDFVEGTCNELALTAVRQVCQAPGSELNPLFIYGGVGTGKTHLLEGIYRQLRRTNPSLQVVFLTSEAFTNYFTQALREHTLPSFRQRFRTVDVLLIDDIDFLDAKRVIQEEFLHTFKQLESHGRQVVVTADRHPRLLSKLSDELRTRFLSGMVCRLEPPDLATREKIVIRKAARLQAEFSPDALKHVAERFTSNVRELEGALHCLQTYHCMTNKRVGISAAKQVLAELERDCIKVVRMPDIERVICDLFGLETSDLKSAKRTRSLSQPRMLAMYLARKHTQAAYSEIGQYFGGRNHSTVISAERKIHDWLKDQTSIKIASQTWRLNDVLETLEQQLQAG